MNPRTFKITAPAMKGDDVKAWQQSVRELFDDLDIRCPIAIDGVYSTATRSYTASLCRAYGMSALEEMKDGVTPTLRIRLRNKELSAFEKRQMASPEFIEWRKKLNAKYSGMTPTGVKVSPPLRRILEDSWGYHPPVHDGIDLIAEPNAVCYAMVKSKIIDVRTSGWWGKGAQASGGHGVGEGDGIVQMEILETVGPFVKGRHIGYGHNEKPRVKIGDIVEAGDPVAHAGFANAWHIHLMYNDGTVLRGIGNLDPRPLVDYAVNRG